MRNCDELIIKLLEPYYIPVTRELALTGSYPTPHTTCTREAYLKTLREQRNKDGVIIGGNMGAMVTSLMDSGEFDFPNGATDFFKALSPHYITNIAIEEEEVGLTLKCCEATKHTATERIRALMQYTENGGTPDDDKSAAIDSAPDMTQEAKLKALLSEFNI